MEDSYNNYHENIINILKFFQNTNEFLTKRSSQRYLIVPLSINNLHRKNTKIQKRSSIGDKFKRLLKQSDMYGEPFNFTMNGNK
jgi:hypothetical protein